MGGTCSTSTHASTNRDIRHYSHYDRPYRRREARGHDDIPTGYTGLSAWEIPLPTSPKRVFTDGPPGVDAEGEGVSETANEAWVEMDSLIGNKGRAPVGRSHGSGVKCSDSHQLREMDGNLQVPALKTQITSPADGNHITIKGQKQPLPVPYGPAKHDGDGEADIEGGYTTGQANRVNIGYKVKVQLTPRQRELVTLTREHINGIGTMYASILTALQKSATSTSSLSSSSSSASASSSSSSSSGLSSQSTTLLGALLEGRKDGNDGRWHDVGAINRRRLLGWSRTSGTKTTSPMNSSNGGPNGTGYGGGSDNKKPQSRTTSGERVDHRQSQIPDRGSDWSDSLEDEDSEETNTKNVDSFDSSRSMSWLNHVAVVARLVRTLGKTSDLVEGMGDMIISLLQSTSQIIADKRKVESKELTKGLTNKEKSAGANEGQDRAEREEQREDQGEDDQDGFPKVDSTSTKDTISLKSGRPILLSPSTSLQPHNESLVPIEYWEEVQSDCESLLTLISHALSLAFGGSDHRSRAFAFVLNSPIKDRLDVASALRCGQMGALTSKLVRGHCNRDLDEGHKVCQTIPTMTGEGVWSPETERRDELYIELGLILLRVFIERTVSLHDKVLRLRPKDVKTSPLRGDMIDDVTANRMKMYHHLYADGYASTRPKLGNGGSRGKESGSRPLKPHHDSNTSANESKAMSEGGKSNGGLSVPHPAVDSNTTPMLPDPCTHMSSVLSLQDLALHSLLSPSTITKYNATLVDYNNDRPRSDTSVTSPISSAPTLLTFPPPSLPHPSPTNSTILSLTSTPTTSSSHLLSELLDRVFSYLSISVSPSEYAFITNVALSNILSSIVADKPLRSEWPFSSPPFHLRSSSTSLSSPPFSSPVLSRSLTLPHLTQPSIVNQMVATPSRSSYSSSSSSSSSSIHQHPNPIAGRQSMSVGTSLPPFQSPFSPQPALPQYPSDNNTTVHGPSQVPRPYDTNDSSGSFSASRSSNGVVGSNGLLSPIRNRSQSTGAYQLGNERKVDLQSGYRGNGAERRLIQVNIQLGVVDNDDASTALAKHLLQLYQPATPIIRPPPPSFGTVIGTQSPQLAPSPVDSLPGFLIQPFFDAMVKHNRLTPISMLHFHRAPLTRLALPGYSLLSECLLNAFFYGANTPPSGIRLEDLRPPHDEALSCPSSSARGQVVKHVMNPSSVSSFVSSSSVSSSSSSSSQPHRHQQHQQQTIPRWTSHEEITREYLRIISTGLDLQSLTMLEHVDLSTVSPAPGNPNSPAYYLIDLNDDTKEALTTFSTRRSSDPPSATLTTLSLRPLAQCSSLHTLRLAGCHAAATDDMLVLILSQCNLAVLDVRDCPLISDRALEALTGRSLSPMARSGPVPSSNRDLKGINTGEAESNPEATISNERLLSLSELRIDRTAVSGAGLKLLHGAKNLKVFSCDNIGYRSVRGSQTETIVGTELRRTYRSSAGGLSGSSTSSVGANKEKRIRIYPNTLKVKPTVSGTDLTFLETCPELVYLSVAFITMPQEPKWLLNLPKLRYLNISGCGASKSTWPTLDNLSLLNTLAYTNPSLFGHSSAVVRPSSSTTTATPWPFLETLVFSHCKLARFPSLLLGPQIKRLNLSHSYLSSQEIVRALTRLAQLQLNERRDTSTAMASSAHEVEVLVRTVLQSIGEQEKVGSTVPIPDVPMTTQMMSSTSETFGAVELPGSHTSSSSLGSDFPQSSLLRSDVMRHGQRLLPTVSGHMLEPSQLRAHFVQPWDHWDSSKLKGEVSPLLSPLFAHKTACLPASMASSSVSKSPSIMSVVQRVSSTSSAPRWFDLADTVELDNGDDESTDTDSDDNDGIPLIDEFDVSGKWRQHQAQQHPRETLEDDQKGQVKVERVISTSTQNPSSMIPHGSFVRQRSSSLDVLSPRLETVTPEHRPFLQSLLASWESSENTCTRSPSKSNYHPSEDPSPRCSMTTLPPNPNYQASASTIPIACRDQTDSATSPWSSSPPVSLKDHIKLRYSLNLESQRQPGTAFSVAMLAHSMGAWLKGQPPSAQNQCIAAGMSAVQLIGDKTPQCLSDRPLHTSGSDRIENGGPIIHALSPTMIPDRIVSLDGTREASPSVLSRGSRTTLTPQMNALGTPSIRSSPIQLLPLSPSLSPALSHSPSLRGRALVDSSGIARSMSLDSPMLKPLSGGRLLDSRRESPHFAMRSSNTTVTDGRVALGEKSEQTEDGIHDLKFGKTSNIVSFDTEHHEVGTLDFFSHADYASETTVTKYREVIEARKQAMLSGASASSLGATYLGGSGINAPSTERRPSAVWMDAGRLKRGIVSESDRDKSYSSNHKGQQREQTPTVPLLSNIQIPRSTTLALSVWAEQSGRELGKDVAKLITAEASRRILAQGGMPPLNPLLRATSPPYRQAVDTKETSGREPEPSSTEFSTSCNSHGVEKPSLILLNLSDSDADDACAQFIGKFVRLEHLSLSDSRVTSAGLNHLKGLETLEVLKLAGLRLSSVRILSRFPRLRLLNIDSSHLGEDCLVHVSALSQLEVLEAFECRITDSGLKHLRGLTRLTRLEICSGKITDQGLVHLLDLRDLAVLNLGMNPGITSKGLALLLTLPNIVHINLSGCGVMPKPAIQLLAHLPSSLKPVITGINPLPPPSSPSAPTQTPHKPIAIPYLPDHQVPPYVLPLPLPLAQASSVVYTTLQDMQNKTFSRVMLSFDSTASRFLRILSDASDSLSQIRIDPQIHINQTKLPLQTTEDKTTQHHSQPLDTYQWPDSNSNPTPVSSTRRSPSVPAQVDQTKDPVKPLPHRLAPPSRRGVVVLSEVHDQSSKHEVTVHTSSPSVCRLFGLSSVHSFPIHHLPPSLRSVSIFTHQVSPTTNSATSTSSGEGYFYPPPLQSCTPSSHAISSPASSNLRTTTSNHHPLAAPSTYAINASPTLPFLSSSTLPFTTYLSPSAMTVSELQTASEIAKVGGLSVILGFARALTTAPDPTHIPPCSSHLPALSVARVQSLLASLPPSLSAAYPLRIPAASAGNTPSQPSPSFSLTSSHSTPYASLASQLNSVNVVDWLTKTPFDPSLLLASLGNLSPTPSSAFQSSSTFTSPAISNIRHEIVVGTGGAVDSALPLIASIIEIFRQQAPASMNTR